MWQAMGSASFFSNRMCISDAVSAEKGSRYFDSVCPGAVKQEKAVSGQGDGGLLREGGKYQASRGQAQKAQFRLTGSVIGKGTGHQAQFQGEAAEKGMADGFFRLKGSVVNAHFG